MARSIEKVIFIVPYISMQAVSNVEARHRTSGVP